MGWLDFLGAIFKPAADLVDELHTSEEEKLKINKELRRIENEFSMKVLDYNSQLLEKKATIIEKEATGQSWIQRSWRPITMLTFLVLVVLDSFGLLIFRLSDQAWTLLQIGLGGYVVGRSAEKIIPGFAKRRQEEAKG